MHDLFARRTVLLMRARAIALILSCVAIGITQLLDLMSRDAILLAASFRVIFISLCLVLPLIFVSDVVSGDFRSGTARLWLQKPIDPLAFYLRRFGERLSISLMLALLALGAARLGTAALGQEVAIGWFLGHFPYLLALACVAFGFSCWVSRGAAFVTLGFAVAGAAATLMGGIDLVGRPWNWIAEAIFIPLDALMEFRDFVAGASGSVWIPLARILAYCVGWTALGALGIWYTTTKGGLPNAERS